MNHTTKIKKSFIFNKILYLNLIKKTYIIYNIVYESDYKGEKSYV